jgi:1,2-diacylglycerol 3-beta-glucosyltransferase
MLRIIKRAITGVILILQAILSFMVGYLLMLTAAALRAPRKTEQLGTKAGVRFLICVPAHNEEKLLPELLRNLQGLDYPQALFAVHLVADNCTDRTAAIAREYGAVVYERFNDELRGKGYALQWLLGQIWETAVPHDAILILDADSIVSPNFLQVMAARIARGEQAVQAYYAVRDPGESSSAGLRYAALAVLHFLRPQGRMVLGGSAGLKGNGMVFTADLLRRHQWSASLTEDIEYHMALIQDGVRVTFAPDAIVWAEMPDSLDSSQTQNARWERGRMEMIRNYVPRLLQRGLRERNFMLVDAAVEQLIPPFSVLTGLSIVSFLTTLLMPAKGMVKKLSVAVGALLLGGQAGYLWSGLRLADAPPEVYRSLWGIPRYVLWKLSLYLRVLGGKDADSWIRTKRN